MENCVEIADQIFPVARISDVDRKTGPLVDEKMLRVTAADRGWLQ